MARTPAPGAQVSGIVLRGDVTARDFADALDALGGLNPGRAVILVALAPPAPASAAVVDLVVDELLARGADSVAVGAGRGVSAHALAAGLSGHTARGRAYEVIDVHESLGTVDLPPGSVLHGRPVSLAWSGATTRVVLARSVTDLAEGYGGALATLATIAPEVPGADPAEVAADLADHLAPHLCVIDATISSDGPDGRHQLRPAHTGALVVGLDPLAVDATLARLHGIDRAASRPVAELLRRRGRLTDEVRGDLTPFVGFERPHPLIRDAWRRAEQAPGIGRVLAAARAGRGSGCADEPSDPLLEGIRTLLGAWVRASGDPGARAVLAGVLGNVAAVGTALRGWQATMAKDDVARLEVGLGFVPAAHGLEEFAELAQMADRFEQAGALAPEREPGLRWTTVDGAVVFQTEREVMAPFTDFIRRVDVAEGISLMADYVGGRRVTVTADADGRPISQAERNIYLPQPNWVTAWGGLPIDVCKIELVERDSGRHRLSWRTVRSPNGSATYDDGSLTFEDTGRGTTVLRVAGRQLFALPQAWSAEGLALVPEVREPLVTESYRRFFAATFDNLEACYEGRPFRVGRAPDGPDTALVTAVLRDLLAMGRQGLGAPSQNPAGRPSGRRPAPDDVDARGFAHFRGTR